MREIRQSGSEGGGFEFNRFPLPLSSTNGRATRFLNCCWLPSVITNGRLGMRGVHGMFGRLSLQVKIIGIIAATVMVVLGVSTLIATFLTRDPVESELYHKALDQARLTAHQIAAPDTLARP